jgi:predicted RNA binding protein YcfA (HicA-like mRNA interferase family)
MPKKIRELETALKKAGFAWESGKGSHRKWKHVSGGLVVISGKPGADAKRYQERDVAAAINKAQEKSED